MALAEGVAVFNSLRSLYEIASSVRNSNDPEKLRIAAGQMFDLALAAREQTSVLQDERNAAVAELASLKAEIKQAQKFEEESKDYTRECNQTGAFIYRQKGSAGAEGQSPYFCPNCFSNGKLKMLNPTPGAEIQMWKCTFGCPECKVIIPLSTIR